MRRARSIATTYRHLTSRSMKVVQYSTSASHVEVLLLENGGKWELSKDKRAIERQYKFKHFIDTWVNKINPNHLYREIFLTFRLTTQKFMTAIAEESKLRNHHPEWSNVGTF